MNENRQCPMCEQIVPRNAKQITVQGRTLHHACAREIAQAYMAFEMTADKTTPKEPNYAKPSHFANVEEKKVEEKKTSTRRAQ